MKLIEVQGFGNYEVDDPIPCPVRTGKGKDGTSYQYFYYGREKYFMKDVRLLEEVFDVSEFMDDYCFILIENKTPIDEKYGYPISGFLINNMSENESTLDVSYFSLTD